MESARPRIDAVCSLFELCTHQEQLSLLEQLPLYLCRDFITLLPQEIVSMILAHLCPKDVLNSCLLVSKCWYHVICDCTAYWKNLYCRLHGLETPGIVLSWRALSVATLIFESSLQHQWALEIQELQTQLEYSNNMICVSFVGRARDWVFYRSRIGQAGISLVHIPKEADNYSPTYTVSETKNHQILPVLWSWSTWNGAIFYGCMGVWLFAPYPDVSNREDMSIVPSRWYDEIRSPAHFIFGGCTKCLLIIQAKRSRDKQYWVLEVIQLLDDSHETRRVPLKFKFLPESPLEISPLLRIHKVSLFPFSSSLSHAHCKSMCEEHYLIVQLGTGVLVYKLTNCRQDGFAVLSGPLHTLCPVGHSWADISSLPPSMACTNFNQLLYVGMLADKDTLTVWNLENGHKYLNKIVTPPGVRKLYVLSVGRLYSVIGLALVTKKLEIIVLSTATGRQVHHFRVPIFDNTTFQDAFIYSNGWLNSITRTEGSFELCVLCNEYHSFLCSF